MKKTARNKRNSKRSHADEQHHFEYMVIFRGSRLRIGTRPAYPVADDLNSSGWDIEVVAGFVLASEPQ